MNEAKPFVVEKRVVMESWLQVKANRGSAGIDDKFGFEPETDWVKVIEVLGKF